MKQLIAALCLSLLLGPVALADTVTVGPNLADRKEQDRIKACHEKAAKLTGDERRRFLNACLKG